MKQKSCEKLEQLKAEIMVAQKVMEKAMSYVEEGLWTKS